MFYLVLIETKFLAVECPPSLVYKECYDRVCEPSCAELVEEDACPVFKDSTCFPGCFCPDGLVRDGERCVRPTECRDCKSNLLIHCVHNSYAKPS